MHRPSPAERLNEAAFEHGLGLVRVAEAQLGGIATVHSVDLPGPTWTVSHQNLGSMYQEPSASDRMAGGAKVRMHVPFELRMDGAENERVAITLGNAAVLDGITTVELSRRHGRTTSRKAYFAGSSSGFQEIGDEESTQVLEDFLATTVATVPTRRARRQTRLTVVEPSAFGLETHHQAEKLYDDMDDLFVSLGNRHNLSRVYQNRTGFVLSTPDFMVEFMYCVENLRIGECVMPRFDAVFRPLWSDIKDYRALQLSAQQFKYRGEVTYSTKAELLRLEVDPAACEPISDEVRRKLMVIFGNLGTYESPSVPVRADDGTLLMYQRQTKQNEALRRDQLSRQERAYFDDILGATPEAA